MEISDILTVSKLPGNKTNDVFDNKEKHNKFKQILEKSIKSDQDYKRTVINKNQKPMDRKLMDVCIEMESIFVSRMLKEMRNTIPKERLIDGGFAEKIFEDMLYDDYALNLSKTSNLGIAKMLYNDLSRI